MQKERAEGLAKRVMISVRPEHARAMEYISLSFRGGFSGWVQSQLDNVSVSPTRLLELRDAKYPGFKAELFTILKEVLGEDAVLQESNMSKTFDFMTDDGTQITVDVVDGHPNVHFRKKVSGTRRISLKQIFSEPQDN